MVEPGVEVDLTHVTYEAVSDIAVRVSGATAQPRPYTVKLEGVEAAGHSRFFMFGVRDPTIVADLDAWQAFIDDDITSRCEELLGPGGRDKVTITVRIYQLRSKTDNLRPR